MDVKRKFMNFSSLELFRPLKSPQTWLLLSPNPFMSDQLVNHFRWKGLSTREDLKGIFLLCIYIQAFFLTSPTGQRCVRTVSLRVLIMRNICETDGQTDGWNDWVVKEALKTCWLIICFSKGSYRGRKKSQETRFLHRRNGPTDGRTDGRTDRQTLL